MADYDAMTAFWDDVSSDVAAMRSALRTHADALELQGAPGPLLEGEGEPYVLIILCIDSEGGSCASMVPERLVDDRLRAALATISGRTFAGAADLKKPQWDAAVLVMSALALEMRDAAELAAWAHDDGSKLPTEEIARYWDIWSGCYVKAWSDLARPTTAVYSLRRAM